MVSLVEYESASQWVIQSVSQWVSQSATQSVSQSASQRVSQSTTQSVSQSASQPVSQSVSQSATSAVSQPSNQLVIHSLSQSVSQPIIWSVWQSTSQLASQPISYSISQSMLKRLTVSRVNKRTYGIKTQTSRSCFSYASSCSSLIPIFLWISKFCCRENPSLFKFAHKPQWESSHIQLQTYNGEICAHEMAAR